jgi:hypothetical protein
MNVTKLGFRPRVVKLKNVTGLVSAHWQKGMPDASAWKELNHASAQRAYITSDGITPLANGFIIGADADINAAGEVIFFEAHD